MRVVMLTQYYPPETGAPQARLSDLARRFLARGHEVEVVTAMPNYPLGRVQEPWRGRFAGKEDRDGVRVHRSWIWATTSKARLAQLLSYFSFLLSSALTAPASVGEADVLLWESPPLFLAPVAWLTARRAGARLVMNVSDLWPRSAIDLGVLSSRPMIRFFTWWEHRSYRAADLVTCQTEGIRDGVLECNPGADTFMYPNGVDVEFFSAGPRDSDARRRHGLPDDAVVVGYAGNFGRSQALHQVLEAAALLAARNDVIFHLVGAGPLREEVARRAAELGLDNLRLEDPVVRDDMPALLSAWDVALVPLADAPVFHGARPSKMFELMAAGLPFVFCGEGEGAAIAERSGAGVVVPPEQPKVLAEALATLADATEDERRRLGLAGRDFVCAHFDREAITDRLEQRLVDLVGRR